MKLQKILIRLQKLHPKEIDLSLDRIQNLCKKLGNPQDKIKAISVVGTNGKQSTINAIFAILNEAKIKCNVYPVPDLNVPFLGVHFTPDLIGNISIGPTATPAWGRENYRGLSSIEAGMTIKNIALLTNQYLTNRGGFRKYVHEQAFQTFRPFLIKSAKKLIPSLKPEYIEPSEKVGIRAQLFNLEKKALVDDFITLNCEGVTHILNAISPAFTSSFELADVIIDKSEISK